jgi:hypothetical protein
MSEIFTPKSDDKLAPAREVGTEYAVVKSSGYLDYVGVGNHAKSRALWHSKAAGGRVIVSRLIGTTDWVIVPQVITHVEFAEVPEGFDFGDFLEAIDAAEGDVDEDTEDGEDVK